MSGSFGGYFTLLLIVGLAYHALFTGKLARSSFGLVHGVAGGLCVLVWLCSDRNTYHWQWIAGYLLAMSVFAVGFRFRDSVRPNALLSHFANISYPLYVVHALTGYAVIYWALDNGAGVYAVILLAALVAYCLSVAIHFGVEKRFMGKARKANQPKGTAIASAP